MRLATLVTNTDDSDFAHAWPLDDAKFAAMIHAVRPDWQVDAFWVCKDEFPGDLSAYDGIELRVKGGGRTFELDVDDGTRHRGREVNRVDTFPTSTDWQTVRVAFAGLETTAHGQPVSVDALDLSALQSLGIYIADGIDGPFRLEVDEIRAYRDAD